jgi:hypothetical protein
MAESKGGADRSKQQNVFVPKTCQAPWRAYFPRKLLIWFRK